MYECKICSFSLSDCISETLKTQFFRQGVPLHFDGYCRVRMAWNNFNIVSLFAHCILVLVLQTWQRWDFYQLLCWFTGPKPMLLLSPPPWNTGVLGAQPVSVPGSLFSPCGITVLRQKNLCWGSVVCTSSFSSWHGVQQIFKYLFMVNIEIGQMFSLR